jgi:hypothetical protein
MLDEGTTGEIAGVGRVRFLVSCAFVLPCTTVIRIGQEASIWFAIISAKSMVCRTTTGTRVTDLIANASIVPLATILGIS